MQGYSNGESQGIRHHARKKVEIKQAGNPSLLVMCFIFKLQVIAGLFKTETLCNAVFPEYIFR